MATTFTYPHDNGVEMTQKPRVLSGQFGDGYEQRTADGINTQPEEWALTFTAQTVTERNAILAFFRARAGVEWFNWTSPFGTTGRWVCSEWTGSPTNAVANSITAKFTQKFDPS